MIWVIIIVVLIIVVVAQANNSKKSSSGCSGSITTLCRTPHISSEDIDFVEQLYDVDISNPDFDEIGSIQYEDDEVMEELERKIANFEICSKEDLRYWYELEGKDMKIYTDKYLKKRFRQKIKEEDFI